MDIVLTCEEVAFVNVKQHVFNEELHNSKSVAFEH